MSKPDEPTNDAAPAGRPTLGAAELVDRFPALPAGDPDRLRDDVDAVVDQRLPGDGRIAG